MAPPPDIDTAQPPSPNEGWVAVYTRLSRLEFGEVAIQKSLTELASDVKQLVKSIGDERDARKDMERMYLKVIAGAFVLGVIKELWPAMSKGLL